MSEAESRAGELVDDGRIGVGLVLGVLRVGENVKLEELHGVRADDEREPLIVGDLLNLGDHDSSEQ